MLIIGDIHGKIHLLQNIFSQYINEESVLVGDLGLKYTHNWFLNNVDITKHKVLFGNHDYYPYLNREHSVGDYDYWEQHDIFLVRGAQSIDRAMRIEGKDYFTNEQILGYDYWCQIHSYYESVKPNIVITHEAPESIKNYITSGVSLKTITDQSLQVMLEIHPPELWIFGHHHQSLDFYKDNTRFICLNEGEVFKI